MKVVISALHRTTSIFSPCNSLTIFWILIPRKPTQQPTGSTFSWREVTATLHRDPASRATDFISMTPLENSGTSISKSRRNKSGCERDKITRGPPLVWATSRITTLSLCPARYRSFGTCSIPGNIPSVRPKSMRSCLGSIRCTIPVTMSPSLPENSSNIALCSASWRRCRMTCFAVCAAIRPALWGVASTITVSPICVSGLTRRAWVSDISELISEGRSATVFSAHT